jgi:RND family efflux transporter MFP subunit
METNNQQDMQPVGSEPNHERVIPPRKHQSVGKKKRRFPILWIIGGVALFLVLRSCVFHSKPALQPGPSVAVAKALRQNLSLEVPIPAEFRPYVESELHAMVTGYVDQMNVDFGDKVKQGQILATLKVPELSDQLHNAMAAQQQAEADYTNAHLIYTRILKVNQQHPNLVAQQDIDTAQSKDAATAAAVAAAKATVEKFQTLVNYTQIIAPFDGIITKRSVDPGALVQAGTSSDKSQSMLRVSDNYLLRLDFPVSVDYVKDVHLGDPVTVRVDSLGGKSFTGKITRFTSQVSDATRTMITEMEVENPNLEIIPGMYAVVRFTFADHPNALTIPLEAISNPKDPVVYVINTDNIIESRPVKLGIESPEKYEVTQGLAEGELVMIGNHSQVHPGEKVMPKIVTQPTIP